MPKPSGKAAKKKQTAAVKNAAEKPTCRYLEKVPEAYVFWCHDGQVFRDINDLLNGFDLMTDEIFGYHANDQKNDFSCWIIDIIGDVELGQEIKKAETRQQAKKAVQQRYYDLTRLEG